MQHLNNALTRGNKNWISETAMPSTTYDTITVGSSGATYTAPANGWYTVTAKTSSSSYSWFNLYRDSGGIPRLMLNFKGETSKRNGGVLPVKKGTVVKLSYENVTFEVFNFIYAIGEV